MKSTFTCFYHNTSLENAISILKQGKLLTQKERIAIGMQSKGLFMEDDDIRAFSHSQFPGTYLNALFKGQHIPDVAVGLIFPVDLLEQNNWHFNIIDQNGHMNENTYCKQTLHQLPNMADVEAFYRNTHQYYPGNELVVHDGIHLGLLKEIWVNDEGMIAALTPWAAPHIPIKLVSKVRNTVKKATSMQARHLDMSSRFVGTFYPDFKYTGIPFQRYSTHSVDTSIDVYKKLAVNAGMTASQIKKNPSKKQLFAFIARRIHRLYEERPEPKYYPPFNNH